MRKQDIADNTQKPFKKQTKHENQKTTNEDKAAIRECGQGAPKVQPGVQRVGPVCQVDSENNWPVRPLMQLDSTDLRPMCYMAALGRHFTFNCCCQGGC